MSSPTSRKLAISLYSLAIAAVVLVGVSLSLVSYRETREAERARAKNEFFRQRRHSVRPDAGSARQLSGRVVCPA